MWNGLLPVVTRFCHGRLGTLRAIVIHRHLKVSGINPKLPRGKDRT